ncbi:MAG: biopolymer transporter ExbD [Verrucomicrobia bacterium]|nr:biopolymer transporter ExbD [Verrucomicrobiota bacterium]
MAGGGGNSESGEPEFQIAPMIDVLLVLLIFFMSITSAEVLRIDKDIKLPLAPDAEKKKKQGLSEGALNVKWVPTEKKAKFNFEGTDYPAIEDLVAIIQRHKEADKSGRYRVIIRGDRNLPAVEVQKAMSVLGQAGLENIAFSALNQ